MTLPSRRLADLGLSLPAVPAPVAAYVPAVRFEDVVYTAGQLPLVDGTLRAVGKVLRILKVVVYVASAPGFTDQPLVANGASRLLGDIFGEAGRHARSAVGVAGLPLDAPVEVELMVSVGSTPTIVPL